MLQTSKYRVYSIGVVSANKEISSKDVMVTPLELLTHLDGCVAPTPEQHSETGEDDLDKSYTVTVNMDTSLNCTWIGDTNRATPPDVRRGERVLIWQYGDVDDVFYWTSLGLDDNLRKLETVRYVFSDTPDEADTEQNADNTYWFEVSTHTKTVTLKTSKANGEPFAYTCQFNCDIGVVTLADDVGNWCEFNSKDTIIKLHNKDDCWISLDKMDFLGNVPMDMTFDVGNDFTFTVGNDVSWTVGNTVTEEIGGEVSWGVGGGVTWETGGVVSFTSASMLVNNDLTVSGNVTVGGALAVSGGAALGGGAAVKGDMAISGGLSVDGPISTSSGVSSPSYG